MKKDLFKSLAKKIIQDQVKNQQEGDQMEDDFVTDL